MLPKKKDRLPPETLEELVPITRAIHHGCLSKNYQAAYQLYNKWVIREDEGFITENLGLVAWDLSILSRFSFLNDSDTEIENINNNILDTIKEQYKIDPDQLCRLLARKAYCIELQGEFETAKKLRKVTIKLYEISPESKNDENGPQYQIEKLIEVAHAHEKLAWIIARTQSLDEAMKEAEKGLNYAKEAEKAIVPFKQIKQKSIEKKYDRFIKRVEEQRYQCQATLGAIYHRLGKLKEADKQFEGAEKFYFNTKNKIGSDDRGIAEKKGIKAFLHSEPGCRFVFLLFDKFSDKNLDAELKKSILKNIENRIEFMEAWNKAEENNKKFNQGEYTGFHQRPPTLVIKAAHYLASGSYYFAKFLEKKFNNNEENKNNEEKSLNNAETAFNEAIRLTQKAHNKSFQCQPLLARATLWRYSEIYTLALQDINNVIDRPDEMTLYQVDAKILKAHTLLDYALSFFKDGSKEENSYRNDSNMQKCLDLVEEAESCLDYLKCNINNLNYCLRNADLEFITLKQNITNNCIKGIGWKNYFKEELDEIWKRYKNNNMFISEYEYKVIEDVIKKL